MLSDAPEDAEAAPPTSSPAGGHARRRRRRVRRRGPWSIRSRVLVLVLIPSLALTALWGTYTASGFREALELRQTVRDVEAVGVSGVAAMVALQEERRLSMIHLARPEADRRELAEQRAATDRELAAMSEAAEPVVEGNPPELKRLFGQISDGLALLPDFRQQVDARAVGHGDAYAFYTGAVSTGMAYFEAEARLTNDARSLTEGTTAAALFRALESLARQNAVLSAGLASPEGMSAEEQRQLTRLVGVQREQWTVVAPALRGAQAAQYEAITAGPEWSMLVEAEGSAMESGEISPGFDQWQASMLQVAGSMQQLTLDQVDFAVGFANDRVDELMTTVILTSVGALLAIALAVLISVLVSRALIRRLRELRGATLRLAQERLPGVIARLKEGDKVELADAVPDIDHGSDEIGQVAGAFDTAQRIAVRAAIEQAETREGISRVFLNLAQRSQGLVHRQLELLDALERDSEEDPDLLAELFRVDHLATRMRRNSENLSILGGANPARRWRRPVGLTEILRAAASQTEDYSRVKLTGIPEVTLAGQVAGDMMHLLSELVENATTFAPPHTSVQVRAEVVPKGLGIEIEDHGIGMDEDMREEANRLLAAAPEFNVMGFTEDTRLGLFVVARLAARHHIMITLRPSPFGGTSAIVLVPSELLEAPEPARPAGGVPTPARRPEREPAREPAREPERGPARTPTGRKEPRMPDDAHQPAPAEPPDMVHLEQPRRRPKQLPRRVRQASMQPQLLHPVAPPAEAAAGPQERSAEEARRLMASYQRQSYRGRAAAERERDAGQDDVAGNGPAREGQWDPR